jgi:hypothetical protein
MRIFAIQANFASPEDVILNKMESCEEGSSPKYIRDTSGILKISGDLIDFDYLARWARDLGLDDIWAAVESKSK